MTHLSENCCAEGCTICGAKPYEPCRDQIDDGDDLEELSGVEDAFGQVVSDIELEMGPGW